MNATTVIGYAYDADLHCLDCTSKRFPEGSGFYRFDAYDLDRDSEGNEILPIFGNQGVNEDDGTHYCCGDCFVYLLTGDLPA